MTKRSRSRRSISRSRSRRSRSVSKSLKGGSYSSASSYGTYVNGSGDSQFSRTFDTSGPYGSRMGSDYIGAQGQGAQLSGTPSAQNLSLIQSAGRHRKRHRGTRKRGGLTGVGFSTPPPTPTPIVNNGKSKSGGLWTQVLNQAIVPLSLLGMQQLYSRSRRSKK
jgi:hypothetical protein